MKATCLAAAVSFGILSLPLQAAPLAPLAPLQRVATEKIHLNKASAHELLHAVKGIGIKRAEAIVRYREAHHGFSSLEELARVPGLGASFAAKNRSALQEAFTLG